MKSIKGVLFDLDGVFYVGNQLISGGNETLSWLRKQGIKYQFISNNTTLSRSALVAKLKGTHRLTHRHKKRVGCSIMLANRFRRSLL